MGGRIKVTDEDLQFILSSLRYRQEKLRERLKRDPSNYDADTIDDTINQCTNLIQKIRKSRNAQL